MQVIRTNDRARLIRAAKEVALRLASQRVTPKLRLRDSYRATTTNTDGWRVVIAGIGRGRPRLEVWLDRFSAHTQRKFWAGFYSPKRQTISALIKRVTRNLWPVRVFTHADTVTKKHFTLSKKLRGSDFNAPILEKYAYETFFGTYDRAHLASNHTNDRFYNRAAAFFEDVIRTLPGAKEAETQSDVYPRCENRKLVAAHLRRERNGYLATQCKERDDFRCRVCSLSFSEAYGEELGAMFAEAHHLKPLGQQGDKVRTKIEDLLTVCANCHRMLHRMHGRPSDWKTLRVIVKRRRLTSR